MSHNLVVPTAPERTRVLGAVQVPDSLGYAQPSFDESQQGLTQFRREDLKRHDLSGVELGPYELGTKLGEGGMGTLYRGLHRKLGKACAVKFIHPSMATNGQAISRFLQEIQAVGQLNHPHIVCALDAGCCDGVHYYVTELLEGQDLQRLVSTTGPVSLERSCDIVRQILEALAHAHDRGFIHRDIKPSNIFLTESGHAKLLDFGLARNIQQTSEGLTSSEQLLGTLDYLAPEQAENATHANAASDLYSLGLTWIYLLSGQPPFPDQQYSTSVSKLRGQMVDQPEWLSRNADSLPTKIRDLLLAMIAKDPRKRLQDCRTALTHLDAPAHRGRSRSFKLAISSALTMVAVAAITYARWSSPTSSLEATVGQQAASTLSDPGHVRQTDTNENSTVSLTQPNQVGNPDEDRPAFENVKTLSSTKSTANAKVVRRSGLVNGNATPTQMIPHLNSQK